MIFSYFSDTEPEHSVYYNEDIPIISYTEITNEEPCGDLETEGKYMQFVTSNTSSLKKFLM